MRYSMKILLGLVSLAVVGAVGAGLFFFYPHSLPEVAASAKQPSGQELIARLCRLSQHERWQTIRWRAAV